LKGARLSSPCETRAAATGLLGMLWPAWIVLGMKPMVTALPHTVNSLYSQEPRNEFN